MDTKRNLRETEEMMETSGSKKARRRDKVAKERWKVEVDEK